MRDLHLSDFTMCRAQNERRKKGQFLWKNYCFPSLQITSIRSLFVIICIFYLRTQKLQLYYHNLHLSPHSPLPFLKSLARPSLYKKFITKYHQMLPIKLLPTYNTCVLDKSIWATQLRFSLFLPKLPSWWRYSLKICQQLFNNELYFHLLDEKWLLSISSACF